MSDPANQSSRPAGGWLTPVGLVVAPALALVLWHGGFRAPAEVVLAAVAAAGLVRHRPPATRLRDPVCLGLAVTAAANLASLAWHPHRSSVAPALATAGVAAVAAIGAGAVAELRERLGLVVMVLGLVTATAGLAGLALKEPPLAERIAGVWRAQGTFEYAPALGLFCVCALAFTLALHADARLDRLTAVVSGAVLVAAAVATFDRVTWLETVAVGVLFAVRVPALRRTIWPVAAAAVVCALLALAISHPSRSALERHLRHGTVSTRTDVWHAAWNAALKRPLLGYGPGRFDEIYIAPEGFLLAANQVSRAHDAVLEQAVEAGLIAAAGTALALLAMLLAGVPALWSRAPARIAFGVTATAVALSGLYDFTWSFPPLVLLGALAALAARETP